MPKLPPLLTPTPSEGLVVGKGQEGAQLGQLTSEIVCAVQDHAQQYGGGEWRCSRGLLLGHCLGINGLVLIAFSLLVFHGFVFIFSSCTY